MSNQLSVIADLGEEADLLLAPDEWLENQRINLQTRMSILADQLHNVLKAQKVKHELQQKNMVALRYFDKHDMTIKFCPLTDAIKQLDQNDPNIPKDISKMNADQQLKTWGKDGYDLIKTKKRLEFLRRRRA